MGNTLVQTLRPAKNIAGGRLCGFNTAKVLLELPSPKLRAGFFDVDGVIVRTDEAAVKSLIAVLRGNALPVSGEIARSAVSEGNSAKSILLAAAPGLAKCPAKLEGMAQELDALTIASVEPTPISDAIPALSRSMLLGIASNRPHRSIMEMLRRLNIVGCFTVVMSITNCLPKPNPEMIVRGLRALSAVPQQAFFVGDKESDRLAGEAAGVKTIMVDVSKGAEGCSEFFRLLRG